MLLQVLQASVDQYKQRHESEHMEPDEMIISAGDYLVQVLAPVHQRLTRRKYMLAAAGCVTVAVGASVLVRRLWNSSDSSVEGGAASMETASDSSSSHKQ